MYFAYDSQSDKFDDDAYLQSHAALAGRGHIRQMSTASRSSAITYRHFSLQPPPFSESNPKEPDIIEPGMEPGIDYQTTLVELENSIGSQITCADYSRERIKISQLDVSVTDGSANDSVWALLKERPNWSAVRWINVNGLSSEAIGPIAQHFKLHPLIVEDMLDIPQRTKVDVFDQAMFACFPLHTLRESNYRDSWRMRLRKLFRRRVPREAPKERTPRLGGQYQYQYQQSTSDLSEKLKTMPGRLLHQWDSNTYYEDDPVHLKIVPEQFRRKRVEIEQVSLYFNDSTVVTFFEQSAASVVEPLLSRLMSPTFILRDSVDSGILAQAIIDTCVDMIHPIVSEYSTRIRRLQIEAIQCPTLTHTRALNVMMSDLTVLRTSVNSMCRMVNAFRSRRKTGAKSHYFQLSDTAVLYFGDVSDHIASYVSDFSIMHEQTKQMTTLIFNTISIRSSNAVRLLSLVTVVFLPLSFLTGYFGMNFTDFDILNNNVNYYWCIAGPFTGALTLLLTYPWVFEQFKNLWHTGPW